MTKMVAAFLDGRRLKGHCFNFSPLRDYFDLFPREGALGRQGTRVELKDLKAIFFVKDFTGNPAYTESQSAQARGGGRQVEITFADRERILGKTVVFDVEKPGFFVEPIDPDSNNLRIFIVNRNAVQVRHSFRVACKNPHATKAVAERAKPEPASPFQGPQPRSEEPDDCPGRD